MGRKHVFPEPRVVLHSFYVQLLLMKLVSNLNCEVQPKVKLSALIDLNLYKSREGPNQEENVVFKSLN